MAEEEGTKMSDLKWLVSQRRQRPPLVRMVSWNFSTDNYGNDEEENHEVVGAVADRLSSNSGDEDDYHSAADDDEGLFVDCLPVPAEKRNEMPSQSDRCDRLEAESDKTDGDHLGTAVYGNSDSVAALHPAHRRRHSRRQKKSKLKKYRMIYADNIAMLANLYDMRNEIEDVFVEMHDCDSRNVISRSLPTLAELCMNTMHKPGPNNTDQSIPILLQKSLTSWRLDRAFLWKQLSWLQNHVLPITDKSKPKGGNIMYYKCGLTEESSGHDVFIFPTRSAWDAVARAPEPSLDASDIYTAGKASSFLLNVDLRRRIFEDIYEWNYLNYINEMAMRVVTNLSALASTIDLMLPITLPTRGMPRPAAETSDMSVAYKQLVANIRHVLHSRYAFLVDELFDKAVPYTTWARGNVALATEFFRDLIQTEKRSRHKAMYLSEIARMHAMFGDTDTAATFYKLAAETALIKSKHGEADIAEATEHLCILLARLQDAGLLTEKKAQDSSSCWNSALNLPRQRLATAVAGIEAFLCFHAHRWRGDSSWIDEALLRVRAHQQAHPYLRYYASMLLALQGKTDQAKMEYEEYRFSVSDNQNYAMMDFNKADGCPWQPLVAIATTQTTSIMPLNVVWRTQLLPPYLTTQRPLEADITCTPPNLRLDSEGHVTGDMQMVLPPIREICLNAYTGSIILKHIPSFTPVWQTSLLTSWSYDRFPNRTRLNCDELFMPTRHLIYKDKTGTSVHFEKAGSRACRLHYNFYPERLILHWRSGGQKARDHGSGDQLPEGQISGGQRASINFTSAIKSKINEDVEEEVRSNEDYSDAMMAEMLEMLHLCLRSNKVTSAKDLEASYKRELDRERRNKKRGKRWRRQNESTDPELYLCGQPLDIHQHNEAIALRDAVFLTFICNVDLYTMFIRTDSKENFLDYRLERRSEGPADRFQVLPNYQLDQTDAQYLLVCTQDRPKELDIYNSAGELVQTLTKMIAEEDSLVFCCPCLVGHDLLAISRNRVSVWKHRIGEEDDGIYYRRRSESQDLSSRLQAKSGTEKQKVLDLKVVGRDIQNEGKLLAVQTTLGVCFLHPRFMTLVPIAVETKRETACPISDDGKMVVGEFSTVKVLSEKSYTDPDSHRVAVSLDNNLLVFDITVTGGDNSTTMKLVSSYSLPGLPLEVCFVGKHDILLTVGQHRETHSLYRDHLFHFSLDGPLNGVLMCLGRGPRSFLPVYLHGNRDAGQCQLEAGWHVYMRDGHGGIICVRL